MSKSIKVSIIGLGYVGLPLAVEFGKVFNTIGFDINSGRVDELLKGYDRTKEIDEGTLKKTLSNGQFQITSNSKHLANSDFFIVTVPTPIDKNNRPDLKFLISASKIVAEHIRKGDVVIYESTVYPGVTEEECIPVIEKESGLKYNIDFFAGYSPERINPGDKKHTLTNILKITSGSTPETADRVDNLYKAIIIAGTFKASSIRVAEAAKVIENSQRDINIAFVNELAKIFNLLKIDTREVLEAASTKWNFLDFKPGLVGGHCIGVDPYYLARKAQEYGYHPEIILAGRRMNDDMGRYIASEFIKLLVKKDIKINSAKVLILGFTFKENCPDVRNTRVIDIINELKTYNINLTIVDPIASINEVKHEYNLTIENEIPINTKFDAIILSVAHNEFKNLLVKNYLNPSSVVYDVKGLFNKDLIDARL